MTLTRCAQHHGQSDGSSRTQQELAFLPILGNIVPENSCSSVAAGQWGQLAKLQVLPQNIGLACNPRPCASDTYAVTLTSSAGVVCSAPFLPSFRWRARAMTTHMLSTFMIGTAHSCQFSQSEPISEAPNASEPFSLKN